MTLPKVTMDPVDDKSQATHVDQDGNLYKKCLTFAKSGVKVIDLCAGDFTARWGAAGVEEIKPFACQKCSTANKLVFHWEDERGNPSCHSHAKMVIQISKEDD